MLALNLRPGQFLAIGDAVVQIVARERHSLSPIRIAIDADASARILRFDDQGNPVGFTSRVIGHAHDSNGHRLLLLKCGHSVTHPHLVDAIECPLCRAEAAPVCQRVKALAELLRDKEAAPE